MKFSYNWIREFVSGLSTAPGALEKLITMKTAECEGIVRTSELLEGACAARLVAVEPIAGTHNVKAVVETERYGVKTVVCGAPNCVAGMVTAYVPMGKKVIHGMESDGMLASGSELDINRDHAGIVDLARGGKLPVTDSIIEIDNKSITHRPDLWGHYGMAREVAAILGLPLTDLRRLDSPPSGPAAIKVEIADLELCPRYSALVFENVTVQPSPLWLQARLTSIGLNPINNIVDMTNYVMAELAQPMHAFDADLLKGDTIFIRPAKHGEPFLGLNDENYTLDPSNLVIADAGGAIALAGVIGGAGSAISEKTTRVVLESANFQAVGIRKTSSAIRLRTDASMRFEKAQDPVNTVRGIARAIELLHELSPGIRIVGGLADAKKKRLPAPEIALPHEWLERKLGRTIEPAEVRQILERLGFRVTQPGAGIVLVTVPSWRATKDIAIKDDLVEEIGRMVGYDSITPVAPLTPARVPPGNPDRRFHHEVRDIFVNQGFTEVSNYSFISEEAAQAFGFDPAEHLRVANPIASDQALMRMSLLPGIWKNITENAKHNETFRLFEIGREIHRRPAVLPDEIPHLVAALYDRRESGILEVKRAAECLMPGAQARPAAARAFEHPARAAEMVWRGATVGRLFELHPTLLETGRAAVLDIDLRAVEALYTSDTKYTPIRRYPSSAFDLSVVAAEREHAGALEAQLKEFAGPLLESIQFQRQYSGEQIGAGRKSVSFRLTVGSAERTLSTEEIGEIRARIIEGMHQRGYELRV